MHMIQNNPRNVIERLHLCSLFKAFPNITFLAGTSGDDKP